MEEAFMSVSASPSRVVSLHPKEYLKQGIVHCGMYSVKAVLSAYGRDTKASPEEYHISWWGRTLGYASPDELASILTSYGVAASVETAEQLSSEQAKLDLLTSILAADVPVLLRIGNGYLPSGRYKPLLGKIVGHWITLWGFDDAEGVFYVYDSGLSPHAYDRTVPIGNTERTYQAVLRDWGNTPQYPWLGRYWRKKYLYIRVASPPAHRNDLARTQVHFGESTAGIFF